MGSSEGTVLSTGRNAGIAKQVISSAIVSIGSLFGGMMQGWTSPMTLQLQSEDSPVGRMTTGEIANMTAIPFYFGPVMSLLFIYVNNKWGRKPALIASAITAIVGYTIIMFSTSQVMLYAGKISGLLGLMGLTLSQMYVSETAHESIRGILMAVCTMQINVGILVGYTLGKYLSFKWFNFVYAVVPAVYAGLLLLIPETPYFLLEKSREDEAKKSLLWLRGGDVHLAEEELEIIKNRGSNGTEEKLTFLQVLKTRGTKIALVISVMAYGFQTVSGIYAVVNFAGIIFEEAGSPFGSDDSAILISVLNLVASFLNLFLIDTFGRKPLLYISFVGGAVSLAILTVFLYILQNGGMDISHVGWIPIGSLGTFIFCYGLGLASVPGLLMNEMTPTNVKPIMGTVAGVSDLIFMCTIIQTFPFLDNNIGLWFCFAMPAICNTVGVFFTFFMVRETKGKSLTQIANELNNK